MPNSLNPTAGTHGHLIRLAGPDRESSTQIAEFLRGGLDIGEGALVIAEPHQTVLLQAALTSGGIDVSMAVETGSLVFRDAKVTLDRFMVEGMPDETLLERHVGRLVEETKAATGGLRAYGEMVGVLWREGNAKAAVELEVQWNRLLKAGGISLLCGYPIDVFGQEFTIPAMDEILREHTCMLPAYHNGSLESAVCRAIRDVIGSGAETIIGTIRSNFRPSWAAVPSGEATILWLRNSLPEYADEILLRAQWHLVQSEL